MIALWLTLAHAASQVVLADSDARCTAHLEVAPGAEEAALVLVLGGTGLYSAQGLGSFLDDAVQDGRVAVLTVDKPGIGPLAADGSFDTDLDTFARYQPQDLVDCAAEAVAWATEQSGVDGAAIALFGHSEGALVATALLTRWTRAGERAPVRGAALAGMPLFGLGEALMHQTGSKDIDTAYKKLFKRSGRNPARFAEEAGAGWDTLYGWSTVPAPVEQLDALAPVPLVLFHGLEDEAVPIEPARWTAALPDHALLQTYEGAGHTGTDTLMDDVVDQLLEGLE